MPLKVRTRRAIVEGESSWHIGEVAQGGWDTCLEKEVEATFGRTLNVFFKNLVFVGN